MGMSKGALEAYVKPKKKKKKVNKYTGVLSGKM